MKDFNLEKRRFVIAGVAVAVVLVYIVRLFTLQLLSDDYKRNADSNAFLKKVEYPSRGVIYDRNGQLLVYNQPAYDIMVVMNEEKGHLDTLEFCNALGITKEFFIQRMNDMLNTAVIPVSMFSATVGYVVGALSAGRASKGFVETGLIPFSA